MEVVRNGQILDMFHRLHRQALLMDWIQSVKKRKESATESRFGT